MHIINSAIKIEGGHLACLIFLPDNQSIKAMVVACHGFRGGKENGGRVNSLAGKITNAGLGLIAFDFAGTGESSGLFVDMTISSQADNLKDIVSFAADTYNVPLIVLGRSLGGSTLLTALSKDNRPAAAVLWSTPVAVRDTFAYILGEATKQLELGQSVTLQDEYSSYDLGAGFWADLNQHDFEQYVLKAGQKPLLVIHGEADELVNPTNAIQIKEKVPQAQVITVPGADHKFIYGWEMREDFTVAWIKHHFS